MTMALQQITEFGLRVEHIVPSPAPSRFRKEGMKLVHLNNTSVSEDIEETT